MTRAQSCWIFSDELLEHTLEFSIRGLMTLGYLFTNSYVSLSEGHSWSFISQRHTLQKSLLMLLLRVLSSDLCASKGARMETDYLLF